MKQADGGENKLLPAEGCGKDRHSWLLKLPRRFVVQLLQTGEGPIKAVSGADQRQMGDACGKFPRCSPLGPSSFE